MPSASESMGTGPGRGLGQPPAAAGSPTTWPVRLITSSTNLAVQPVARRRGRAGMRQHLLERCLGRQRINGERQERLGCEIAPAVRPYRQLLRIRPAAPMMTIDVVADVNLDIEPG